MGTAPRPSSAPRTPAPRGRLLDLADRRGEELRVPAAAADAPSNTTEPIWRLSNPETSRDWHPVASPRAVPTLGREGALAAQGQHGGLLHKQGDEREHGDGLEDLWGRLPRRIPKTSARFGVNFTGHEYVPVFSRSLSMSRIILPKHRPVSIHKAGTVKGMGDNCNCASWRQKGH